MEYACGYIPYMSIYNKRLKDWSFKSKDASILILIAYKYERLKKVYP